MNRGALPSGELCPQCKTPLAEVGPPINDVYCPNLECTRERDLMLSMINGPTAEEERRRLEVAHAAQAARIAALTEAVQDWAAARWAFKSRSSDANAKTLAADWQSAEIRLAEMAATLEPARAALTPEDRG